MAGMLWILLAGLSLGAGDKADVNAVAEGYVRLVLEVGLYEPDYVDAYFGPPGWKPSKTAKEESFPGERLSGRADALIGQLRGIHVAQGTELEKQRLAFLEKQLLSVRARIDLLAGKKMSFDEEAKALYDVDVPRFEEADFAGILKELDEALPGEGDVYSRFNSYRVRFTVRRESLEKILEAAIGEYRRRTTGHVTLPASERFEIRLVAGKPWGAAVTYQGKGASLVEVNADVPFCMEDVLNLAGHEIYPGHHVHLSLLDRHLVQRKGWVEFSVLPLHSPLALVCEGLAVYGSRELIGSAGDEFERAVLYPLAGLDPAQAQRYGRVIALKDELDIAKIEAARRYLDGRMDRTRTRIWLCEYCLVTPGAAENLIRFIEQYRSYIVNYTVGRRLVGDYIEKRCGSDNSPKRRWQCFEELLSTPQTPSRLAGKEW